MERSFTRITGWVSYYASVALTVLCCIICWLYFIACVAGWQTPPTITLDIFPERGNIGIAVVLLIALFATGVLGLILVAGSPMKQRELRRDFRVKMEDVLKAYNSAHAADRAGVFTLQGEYDGVRERMERLLQQPELQELEVPVLELAAQMSQTSQALAQRYNDVDVERAYKFLQQRREECERFEVDVDNAQATLPEIQREVAAVQLKEDVLRSKRNRIADAYAEILAPLGLMIAEKPSADVIQLQSPEQKK